MKFAHITFEDIMPAPNPNKPNIFNTDWGWKWTGVYIITNKINGKVYIGSASYCLRRRTCGHINDLDGNRHRNIHLQRAWNQYGRENFKFEVLQGTPTEDCLEVEQAWINYYDSANPEKGYNICKEAASVKGIKHREESIPKHVARAKKQFSTEEGRKKASDAAKKRYSDIEQRDLLSKTISDKYKNDPSYYKRVSKANVIAGAMRKISNMNTKKSKTEETLKKINYARLLMIDLRLKGDIK